MKPPSKKITILLIVCACIIIGTFLFKNVDWATKINSLLNPSKQSVSDKNATELVDSSMDKDSDNDGLKDWEEVLWHTDPHNPDTDGDGTPDGAEVKEGRDPTIPNTAPAGSPPNDLLKKTTVLKNIIENSTASSTNATDAFSKEFLAQYLNSSEVGQPMSTSSKDELIGNLVAEQTTGTPPPQYTASDIQVSTDGSQEAIHSYGNSLGEVITDNQVTDLDNELSILNDAVTNQNKERLNDLDPIIQKYQAIVTGALKINVPPSAATLHLNFINTVNDLARSISPMKLVIDDPLTTLKSLNTYSSARDALVKSISDFADYFKANGVVFNTTEYGYTFRTGI